MLRGLRAALAGLGVLVLAGCTVSTGGVAVSADRNQPVVALMDTGKYATTAGSPVGTAGDNPLKQAVAEVHRMAPYVVGPWQIDSSLVSEEYFATVPMEGTDSFTLALVDPITEEASFGDALAAVGNARGFIVGFSTGRVDINRTQRLQNAVLRFPDAESAAAAAKELAAIAPPAQLKEYWWTFPVWDTQERTLDAWRPDACPTTFSEINEPGYATIAADGSSEYVRNFVAHGPYVLYQFVAAPSSSSSYKVCDLTWRTLVTQQALIDKFVPTDQSKMAELPIDETGHLRSRTLEALADLRPWSNGVWPANGWLNFEDNPVTAAKVFKEAGVDWVSRQLTAVYQARDTAGASKVVDLFATETAALSGVKATDTGVPGFPSAKCFAHTEQIKFAENRQIQEQTGQVYWQYKCIGQADRYAFIAFSRGETDAKQQISAQYRILAGE